MMFKKLFVSAALAASLLLPGVASASSPVNINTATAAEMAAALSGVGPARAEAIVAYREEKGEFVSVEELTQVRGIGAATLERNRDLIRLEDAD